MPGLRIELFLLGALSLLMVACGPDDPAAYPKPTTFVADLPPQGLGFPNLPWPQDNPPTVEGVALGKRLFLTRASAWIIRYPAPHAIIQTGPFPIRSFTARESVEPWVP